MPETFVLRSTQNDTFITILIVFFFKLLFQVSRIFWDFFPLRVSNEIIVILRCGNA